jgi:hypothetical protein
LIARVSASGFSDAGSTFALPTRVTRYPFAPRDTSATLTLEVPMSTATIRFFATDACLFFARKSSSHDGIDALIGADV